MYANLLRELCGPVSRPFPNYWQTCKSDLSYLKAFSELHTRVSVFVCVRVFLYTNKFIIRHVVRSALYLRHSFRRWLSSLPTVPAGKSSFPFSAFRMFIKLDTRRNES